MSLPPPPPSPEQSGLHRWAEMHQAKKKERHLDERTQTTWMIVNLVLSVLCLWTALPFALIALLFKVLPRVAPLTGEDFLKRRRNVFHLCIANAVTTFVMVASVVGISIAYLAYT